MGHCQSFDTLGVLKSYFGVVDVVLSKLALLTKLKQEGRTKHRPFGRLSLHGVPRNVLSRLEVAVEDPKHLLRVRGALEWLVVDVVHALHNVHVRTGPCSIVFKVLGLGGKSSPNIWASLRLPWRVVSPVFNVDEFRCEMYMDGPRGKFTHLNSRAAGHPRPGGVTHVNVRQHDCQASAAQLICVTKPARTRGALSASVFVWSVWKPPDHEVNKSTSNPFSSTSMSSGLSGNGDEDGCTLQSGGLGGHPLRCAMCRN